MEAMVQQRPCTERCDVVSSLSLRSYLCRRLQDKHSCLEPKGGEIDLLLDV